LLVAAILTLVAVALYLLYETAALLEEDRARRANRKPRFVTISEIVRSWELHHRPLFLLVCFAWVVFGIWFAVHIIFSCCP
jgi:hypothetical protein